MKKILIIEDPKSCVFCPVFDGEIGKCKEGGIIEDNENPTKCPLHDLPARKHRDTRDEIKMAIDYGWNSCLAALEGKDMIDKLIESLDKAIDTAERILAGKDVQ